MIVDAGRVILRQHGRLPSGQRDRKKLCRGVVEHPVSPRECRSAQSVVRLDSPPFPPGPPPLRCAVLLWRCTGKSPSHLGLVRPSQLPRAGVAMDGLVAPEMGASHQVEVRERSGVGHRPLWIGLSEPKKDAMHSSAVHGRRASAKGKLSRFVPKHSEHR